MVSEKYQEIKTLLGSTEANNIHQGLMMIREELPSIDEESARSLFEMVSVLFHVDLFDHPDQVGVVDEAISLVADFGEEVIPYLLNDLDAGDTKG